MKRALVFLISFAALTAVAQAATTTTTSSSKPLLGNHDSNAPITIAADNFQADLNGKSGVWTGNVLVVQGDTKLRANTVKMTTVNGKTDKIFADGNVVVDSPNSGTATGDKGVYSVVPRTVRLSEAPSHGLPVLVYDQRCAGAQAYVSLAAEMLGDE